MEKSLFRCAKATLQKFSVLWRSEKANFPNRKEIPFSLSQNKLDGNSSVLVPWKNEFSECETNHFILVPNQTWNNFLSFDVLKLRIFRIRSKSLVHGVKILLTRLSEFWRHQNANFPNAIEIAIWFRQKLFNPIFCVFGTHIIRIFRIRKKWLFHCAIPTLKEFSALWLSQ